MFIGSIYTVPSDGGSLYPPLQSVTENPTIRRATRSLSQAYPFASPMAAPSQPRRLPVFVEITSRSIPKPKMRTQQQLVWALSAQPFFPENWGVPVLFVRVSPPSQFAQVCPYVAYSCPVTLI